MILSQTLVRNERADAARRGENVELHHYTVRSTGDAGARKPSLPDERTRALASRRLGAARFQGRIVSGPSEEPRFEALSQAELARQRVAAIIVNAEAGLRWIDRPEPSVAEVRALLEEIVRDGGAAARLLGPGD
jgi:hypothetical protein